MEFFRIHFKGKLFGIAFGLIHAWLCISSYADSHHRDHLKVGVLQISKNVKYILLGVERPNHQTSQLHFSSLGFEGPVDHIDPKFLLEVDHQGIQKVRSFEIENLSASDQKKSDYEYNDELPAVLLSTSDAHTDEVFHSMKVIASRVARSLGFPIATTAAAIQMPLKHHENLYRLQAAYMMEIINRTLPPYNKFPQFKKALSANESQAETFLQKLGEAFLTRYNQNGLSAGLSIKNENGNLYSRWRTAQAGERKENKGYFIQRANELELKVAHLDDDFDIVFVDPNQTDLPSQEHYVPKFMGLGSSKLGPRDIAEKANQRRKDAETFLPLIPWYLASYVNPKGPVDLVSFVTPGKSGNKLKALAHRNLAFDFGGSIIPFSNLLIKGINHAVESHAYSNEVTKYLSRLVSYGSLLALTETNAYQISPGFESGELSGEPFLEALQKISHQEAQIDTPSPRALYNEIVAQMATEEEKLGRLLGAPTHEELKKSKKILRTRLQNHLRAMGLLAQNPKTISRSPCGFFSKTKFPQSNEWEGFPAREPVIVFMIDGLRPDRFKQAAQQGLMPNLKSLFIDRGVRLDSYAYRSLTLPSWSSILTGFKPDMHGIRSNTPTSRLHQEVTDNFQDPRKDFLEMKNHLKNRAFQRLEEDATGEKDRVWLSGYYHPDQTIYNYMPVVADSNSAIRDVIKEVLKQNADLKNGSLDLPSVLDEGSAERMAQLINEDRDGKIRLLKIWFASLDEATHYNNKLADSIYSSLDQYVGKILKAAHRHPVMKKARVFLVSDHGHTGGYGPFDQNNSVLKLEKPKAGVTEGPLLSNTGFNLVRFFAGEYYRYPQYRFAVGASNAPNPKFDHRFLRDLHMEPFNTVYPKGRGAPGVLVDSSGDNLAQVYLKKNNSWDRVNYKDITQFPNPNGGRLNILKDLLDVKLTNIMITDRTLAQKITELTDHHPVDLFAMALRGEPVRKAANRLISKINLQSELFATREPVLVLSRRLQNTSEAQKYPYRAGLILTHSDKEGNDHYLYLVLKSFDQPMSGTFQAEISDSPEDDPLEYAGRVIISQQKATPQQLAQWRTDREWLTITRNERKPTAIFSLSSALTLAPKFTDPNPEVSALVRRERRAEIPDFILVANPGFGFHSETPMESDHGGLSREETRNSFYVSSLVPTEFSKHHELNLPVFNHDIMPTILDFAGLGQPGNHPLPKTQGVSFRSWMIGME